MSKQGNIIIKGARVHNLKNIDVEIPRGQFVVITGLSGSGKSSLAFDTLYAEGQRRYVESLSAYARQFLGRMSKPEVDFIKGIPPAIAIEQKVNTRNPRSTVGTSTEIYEYVKLLYARIGKTYSPVSGEEVKKHSAEDVVDYAQGLPEGTRILVLAPVVIPSDRTVFQQLEMYLQQGFSRVQVTYPNPSTGGELVIHRLSELIDNLRIANSPLVGELEEASVFLVIDRLEIEHNQEAVSRLTDAVETAFYEGKENCFIRIFEEKTLDNASSSLSCGEGSGVRLKHFSKKFEADGIVFETPNEQMFAFNSPLGACPVCEGFGRIIGIDEDLVVPNKSLSVYEDAIACWKGETMGKWKQKLIYNAGKFKFPIHKPYYELTEEQRRLLWTGNKYFGGLNDFFNYLESEQYKIQYRVMLARYRGKTVCPACGGSRLKKEASYVKINKKSIHELVNLSIIEIKDFFDSLKTPILTKHEEAIAKRLLIEINSRIQFLLDVGLGYLTLNRLSNTLSGGESQRINLATSLGSSLVGSLYILDEPSIGLHPRDTNQLISVLRQLKKLGNTVVVVEHDEEIIRAADYIIDIGPHAGRLGGEVMFQGTLERGVGGEVSYTLRYLSGLDKIEIPATRRKWSNYIEALGARENNLKGINVKFPLNIFTVVTGVSGSGKSSLVRDIFYLGLKKSLGEGTGEKVGNFSEMKGSIHLVKNVEFVDQNPIGKSSRSNPVTYIKAYDEVRKLFSEQQFAKQMGFSPAHFSFNVEGGRCEECQGEGTVTVEMQFMADLVLECESCRGMRFKPDVLEVMYRNVNIYNVLEMTVNQAIEFFGEDKTNSTAKKIVKRLKPLQDVGIGYIKLGQSSSTLSGGESQRVKLASFLANEKNEPTIFIFDEPTTGLHFHDIKTLLAAFDALIAKGHTIITIEHNPDVIKCADHIIDLGPEGGQAGGYLVFEGTPEKLLQCEKSYTGKYLKLEK